MQQTTEQRPARLVRPMQAVRERNLPRTKLYESLASGELRHVRFGRSILIRETDLDAWLDRYTQGGDEPRAA